jgi:hypothetical protein
LEFWGREVVWLDYFNNEYIWLWIMNLIAQSSIDAIIAFKIIAAFNAIIFHRFLSLKTNVAIAFVFLLNPITIDLLNAQLRSGLAFSFFLIAIMLAWRTRTIIITLFVLTFVHTIMLGVLLLYVLSIFVAKLNFASPIVKIICLVAFSTVFGLAVSIYVPNLLISLSDRRDIRVYDNVSFFYVAFWIFWGAMLAILVQVNRRLNWDYFFGLAICVAVPTMVIGGFPGFRFLAISMPIIISCIAYLRPLPKTVMLITLFLYQVVQFTYWLPQRIT